MNKYWALLIIGAFGSTVGCDIAYEPVICNGFSEPITVIYVNKAVLEAHALSMEAATCKPPSDATRIPGEAQPGVAGSFYDGVTVISRSGKTLAYFDVSALSEKPRLHAPQQLMLVEDGIFQVPREFRDDWSKNIEKVQQISPRSWPNLKGKQ